MQSIETIEIGSLFGRGVVCMILARYIANPNLLPALDDDISSSSMKGAIVVFSHWVFIYEVYEEKKESLLRFGVV